MPHLVLRIISSPYENSNWSYSPQMVKLGFDLCELHLWSLTLNFCMDITFVDGNYPRKFNDEKMTGTLSQHDTSLDR